MKQKFRIQLPHGIFATLTLALDVPPYSAAAAENKGIGKEDLKNLVGQEFQRIADELGLSEPGGV